MLYWKIVLKYIRRYVSFDIGVMKLALSSLIVHSAQINGGATISLPKQLLGHPPFGKFHRMKPVVLRQMKGAVEIEVCLAAGCIVRELLLLAYQLPFCCVHGERCYSIPIH